MNASPASDLPSFSRRTARQTRLRTEASLLHGADIANRHESGWPGLALATILGVAAGNGILRSIVVVAMRNTMPDLGTLISISAATDGLAALAGIVVVTLAPLLTVKRLRPRDIPSALRVVE
jgi:hypothetical protein